MKEYFPNVSKIQYEGETSTNPFAFKYFNPDEVINGKTMKEHLRFTLSYWHTLCGAGSDPFGSGTMERPWLDIKDPIEFAKAKMDACFEIMEKLNIDFFAFHDRDIAPEGKTLVETNAILDEVVAYCDKLMKETGKKLLWGTANMFSHPRFMHGASTTCEADIFAFAAAQVKKAMEVTKLLGGENYVFWGGREGYETLLNTNMKLEEENFARFLKMAVDYKKKIGFTGELLIEPKPKEPTKHQYDTDAATVLGFLRKYGLEKEFKLNIEANHATLAGHTFEHDVHLARINGALGSIDANMGDPNLGWDTDQFPTNIYDATYCMYEIIQNGGLGKGGLNFDSKPRRASFEPEDIFLSYISGMDTFAKGFKVALKLIEDGVLENFKADRYATFNEGIGKDIVEGKVDFETLEKYALEHDQIKVKSGRQEMLESIVNQYIFSK
ncbi:xylose isomerase [Cellulosilyticum sp. I15G10I2]|uniref:xylose isomerase n=1 Tax=Cellulosilyticum sp. I15G10I2 TaxID=1892843 RepID=UPI00085C1A98|nr:xylose isomerase [Cellulosilyticum sp. I15G10I2]